MGKLIDDLHSAAQPASQIARLLSAYAESLRPWARQIAARMIGEVDKKDRAAWSDLGHGISEQLHRDLRRAPVGIELRRRLADQVTLITSIPRQAGERVHKLALEGLVTSARAREVAEEIRNSTGVAESRATLIARTEVARTAATLAETRARAAGSTHYIWRTANDSDVRPGHQKMEGRVCEWANPPAVNENGRIINHHPGEIWNCRCYAEPILPDPYKPRRRGRTH